MEMHNVTGHEINEVNEAISIHADEPSHGGASHEYWLDWKDQDGERAGQNLHFQCGPVKEVGVNGVTHEALLTILIDRLLGFQDGQYACPENVDALHHLNAVMDILKERTRKRDERGVEGTSQV